MKMMMKAEIASEMIKSRSHTPRPGRTRATGARPGGAADSDLSNSGSATSGACSGLDGAGMRPYSIQKRKQGGELYDTSVHGYLASRTPSSLKNHIYNCPL